MAKKNMQLSKFRIKDFHINFKINITKKQGEKIALGLIAFVAIVYAYYTYLFTPEYAKIKQTQEQLKGKQSYYNQIQAAQANPAALDKNIVTYEQQAQTQGSTIPPVLDKPQITVDLYTIAKLHSVQPQSLKFEQLQDKGTYQQIAMTLTVIGQTDNVFSMITDIRHTPLDKLAVQSVELGTQKPSAGNGGGAGSQTGNTSMPALANTTAMPSIEGATANNSTGAGGAGAGVSEGGSGLAPTPPAGSDNILLSANIKIMAFSSKASSSETTDQEPAFMQSGFGVNSPADVFKPKSGGAAAANPAGQP